MCILPFFLLVIIIIITLMIKLQCKERETVWEFHDFSVIQILREINLGESCSRSSKNAFFAILGV